MQEFQNSNRKGVNRLNLAENEMHHLIERLADGLGHAMDRPSIEIRILSFLGHSNGPSTAGIAAEMGISPRAAEVHLSELEHANRVWNQPCHGATATWHISHEGRHYIKQRGLLRTPRTKQRDGYSMRAFGDTLAAA